MHRQEDGTLRAISGPDQTMLRTPVPLRGEGLVTVSEFTIAAGEHLPFTLTYAPSHLVPPDLVDPSTALAEAERFWAEWSGRARVEESAWRGAVMRSLNPRRRSEAAVRASGGASQRRGPAVRGV